MAASLASTPARGQERSGELVSLGLELQPERAFLRHRRSVAIVEFPGFVRGRHRLPKAPGRGAESFIHELGAAQLEAEVREVYAASKRVLGLRRRQLSQALAEGGGNVETPQFHYAIELGLDPEDIARALWQRRVMLLISPRVLPVEFDALFPVAADELVVPFAESTSLELEGKDEQSFDLLVERLEDFAEQHGGGVEEDEAAGRASLLTHDGSRIALDLGERELSLQILGTDGCRALLLEAHRRFAALAGPIISGLPE